MEKQTRPKFSFDYRQIVEMAQEGIWVAKPDGETIFVNQKMADMLGYQKEEILGKSGLDFLCTPTEAEVLKNRKILDANRSVQTECKFKRKNGSALWTISSTGPFFENGRHAANISMHTDVTERKKAEEELKQAQAKLKEYAANLEGLVEERSKQVANERNRLFTVLETLPVMICLLTPDHYVTFGNRSFREKYGESKGRRCYDQCFGIEAPCSFCQSYTPLKTGKPHRWQFVGREGSIIESYDFPFTDTDSSPLILVMDIDITETKNMIKQLRDQERLVAIGQTAGMVGHDLRNPLQAIINELYIAKSELDEMPEGQAKTAMSETIEGINSQVNYMNKIVSDLQTFVKPVEVNKKTVNLAEMITSTLAQANVPANIQTNLTLEDLTLEADPQLLQRVLINLLTNAVQAMQNGGELTVKSKRNGKGEIQIDVEDSGEGIPEEIKPKIFTPLFTTKSKGQGFGLAVCKKVIEAQGGTITFESRQGKGTKFTIRLPKNSHN